MCSPGRRPATRLRHHGEGHRPGEWAVLRGLDRVHGRDCYLVEFPDGVTAWWPVASQDDRYEFEQVVSRLAESARDG